MRIIALKRQSVLESIAWILATWFGSGCSPKAPGTVGSFFSLPLILIGILGGSSLFICVAFILFFVGWWATDVVLKTQKDTDPGFVVIDETVGQMLTFALIVNAPMHWYVPVLGFALFRFFDIVKIWPASFFDKIVHNAFGVMADDVVAGIYAALVLYGVLFLL